MSETPKSLDPPIEAESSDRWVAGKTREELLADLKVYLARLRDNPHSLVDRLRAAAIQLRLGRTQEALIHYEGVLRGYVAEGQIMSAIALCQRILGIYPELPRVQRILAALYARAPRDSGLPHPVTPVEALEERPTTTFAEGEGVGEVGRRRGRGNHGADDREEGGAELRSIFSDGQGGPLDQRGRGQRERLLHEATEEQRPTMPYQVQARPYPEEAPTQRAPRSRSPSEPLAPARERRPSEPVALPRERRPSEPLAVPREQRPSEPLAVPRERRPSEPLAQRERPPSRPVDEWSWGSEPEAAPPEPVEEEVVLLTRPKPKRR